MFDVILSVEGSSNQNGSLAFRRVEQECQRYPCSSPLTSIDRHSSVALNYLSSWGGYPRHEWAQERAEWIGSQVLTSY